MQISWTKVKDALLNLTTSNKLTEAEAKAIEQAIESDASVGTAATTTPVVQAAVSVPAVVASSEATAAPVSVAQVATLPTTPAPVATVPVQASADADELARLKAENARLKAQITPAVAAAVPIEDLTQTGGTSGNGQATPNAYYEDLKRIKAKFTRFGLTNEIDLGEESH